MPHLPVNTAPEAGARLPASGRRGMARGALRAGARLLALACAALLVPAAAAAGRVELSQTVVEPLGAERAAQVQEMRRQLLEHQRQWRGNAGMEQSRPLRDMPPTGPGSVPGIVTSPAGTTPLGAAPLGPVGAPPLVDAPLGAPGLRTASPGAVLPGTPLGITPLATPSAAPSVGDSRLTDRERNLLRQQLRQLPRLQTAPGPSSRPAPVSTPRD